MRQAENSAAGMIKVTVAQFGRENTQVLVPIDSTVATVLEAAGVSINGNEELFVEAQVATMDAIMEDGDILSVVTPKQAA